MSVEQFRKLHHQEEPLLLANVWDVVSRKQAEEAGAKAVGTSSHVIANMLGYEDGENIPFKEMFFVIEKIAKNSNILISADIESGYSINLNEVVLNIEQLIKIGVVGINLEDGIVKDGKRSMVAAEKFAEKIQFIKKELKAKNMDIYLNARTDTYTTKHPDALQETLRRVKLYEAAGADGIFVPLIQTAQDIKAVVEATKLPLNTFVTPYSLPYEQLRTLGVKRCSSGDKAHAKITAQLQETYHNFCVSKNFESLFK